MEIKNLKVEKVLVEEKLDVDKEYYVGVIIDASREVKAPVVMFSTEGEWTSNQCHLKRLRR